MQQRLLVLSNNALSDKYNNGITTESIISCWESENIAHMYFKNEEVFSNTCQNFYRYTDRDALFGLLFPNKYSGLKFRTDEVKDINEKNLQVKVKSDKGNKKSAFIGKVIQWDSTKLFREIIWQFNRWKNKSLFNWIEEFSPQVILFVGGDTIFMYRITQYLKKKYNCKVVFYQTDDHSKAKFSLSPFYWIRLAWLHYEFVKMVKTTDGFATIGDAMSEEYKRRFKRSSVSLMNAVQVIEKDIHTQNSPIKFVYLGGLHLNRWKSLENIAKAIELINEDKPIATLEIYTGSEITSEIDGALNRKKTSSIIGHITKNEVSAVMRAADVLIHVEAFDKKNIHITRLSISTKIPEYMMHNRCILGVGPMNVASMKYIKDFAVTINNPKVDVIKTKILELINNPEKTEFLTDKAYEAAVINHNIVSVHKKFLQIIDTLEDEL